MKNVEVEQLVSLSGQPLELTLTAKDGSQTSIKLACLVPHDWVMARQELIGDRQRRFIESTASSPIDPTTKAKTLAEIATCTVAKSDLITDSEGSVKLLELAARRAGFKGNWLGFLNGLLDSDVVELQNKLLAVCGYKVDKEPEGNGSPVPFQGTTMTAP